MSDIRIGLIGAGTIGRTHVRAAAATTGVVLAGIADPSLAANGLASECGVARYPDHHSLLKKARPDGVIVATPNALHVPVALDCVAAGIPALVGKPIADTVGQARRLSEAAEQTGVPLLIGHHRRHNPIIRRARELVAGGSLGRLVSVSVLAMFLKPDSYFEVAWRRSPGGGPVLLNLIHEIDLLRFVCGEIASVQAITSNAVRGFAVEDTAAVMLQLANGAVATVNLSDTAVSPWSWELTSGENPAFFNQPVESHFICGTDASVTLPRLNLWRYKEARGWDRPLTVDTVEVSPANPYVEQMRHFRAVIRGEQECITTGPDATRTLEATLAVKQAGETGAVVPLP